MLHPIPESSERHRLVLVMELQRTLIEALCALPVGEKVSVPWLRTVWPAAKRDWVARFWMLNKRTRARAIIALAKAPQGEKARLLQVFRQQREAANLYNGTPGYTVPYLKPKKGSLDASFRDLLESFYAPVFYAAFGYTEPCAASPARFSKDSYIGGISVEHRRICPYCDNVMRSPQLDHFLPKSIFPALSCDPDNLIPCCMECNSITQKGDMPPLDEHAQDQAGDWFHPRWRSAQGRYRARIDTGGTSPRLVLEALSATDTKRVENLDRLFGLSTFWSVTLEAEIQLAMSDASDYLREAGRDATMATVRKALADKAQEHGRATIRGLSIKNAAIFRSIADTDSLSQQALERCVADSALLTRPV